MKEIIISEVIERKIFIIRGHRIMLDQDLAKLYRVTTGNLNKAVKRNLERFPEDCVPRTYRERRFSFSSMMLCKR